MITKTQRGGVKGVAIVSQKQKARQLLLNDLTIANYSCEQAEDPMLKRAFAVLAGLVESSLIELEK